MSPTPTLISGADSNASYWLTRTQKRNRARRERTKQHKRARLERERERQRCTGEEHEEHEEHEERARRETAVKVVEAPHERSVFPRKLCIKHGGSKPSEAMRITTEVIENANKYSNALGEWTLALRDSNIEIIENMGLAAKHNYDCIDFTNNDIHSITGFPELPTLDHLMIMRNRVTFIDPNIGKMLPRLMDLAAQNNSIAELGDLVPLGGLPRLEHLALINNPVTSKENYVYFVIWLCPNVRFLDFQHVKLAQRQKAKELFGTKEAPTTLAKEVMAQKSNEFEIPTLRSDPSMSSIAVKVDRMNLKPEEAARLQQIIGSAKTIEEVEQLEKNLSEGRLPLGVISKR